MPRRIINFCVIGIIKLLRDAELFQSRLTSLRILQGLFFFFFMVKFPESLAIVFSLLFYLFLALPHFTT